MKFSVSYWKRSLLIFAAGAGIVLYGITGFAQSSSSGVNGVVTDPNGAVVPGASVALVNVATNVERNTVSNASGNYFFAEVPPARYTLMFTAKGFEKESIAPFDVAVAQVVTVNAALKVGSTQESVTVTAENTEVETASAQLGTVIDNKAVTGIPLNGRNFTQMLELTPGVTPISTGQNSSGTTTSTVAGSVYDFPSINGAYNRSTLYLLDGMNNNNGWYNSYAVPVIIDLVQEFKINSHSESEYGGVIGGVVNMATVQGTNVFHGKGWEYARSNSFDANPYISAPPDYHLNMYGFILGGPVSAPKLYSGKDKTFFEIAYEGTHYTTASGTPILIPTAAQLGETTFGGAPGPTADFSTGACPATGGVAIELQPCQLWDPTAGGNSLPLGSTYRRPYNGNQIPTSEFNKYQLKFISDVFGTNGPIVIPGILPTVFNFQINSPITQNSYNYSARVDEHLGVSNFIFARYSEFQSRKTSPSNLPKLFTLLQLPSQQYGASWTHLFSPTLSMQVQYARSHVASLGNTLFTNHSTMWQDFGCDPSMCDSFVGGIALLGTQTVSGGIASGFSAGESNSPSANISSIHEWSGAVFKVWRNHQLQAGGGWDEDNYTSYLRQSTTTYSGASTSNFNGNLDSPAGITKPQVAAQTGSSMLDFLIDYPNQVALRNVLITERPGGIGSIYVQDSWKMNQRLTVNYGIRYDRGVIPAYGTDASIGLQGSIETGDMDFTDGQYIVQKLPPLCSVRGHAPCLPSATLPANVVVAPGERILHGNKLNFSPRFGFAYRVNDKLAVRGGFGIFWDNWSTLIQMAQNYQGSWPDTGTLQVNSTNTPGTVYTSAQNPFGSNSAIQPAATPFTSTNVNYMVSPYWKNPYSEQYNLGIEKQLWLGSILGVNYVGSVTHRLDVGGYYNTGTPCGSNCPGSFPLRQAAGTTGQLYPYAVPQKSWDHAGASSSYNSLQVSFVRSFRKGLGYGVSYTWSKTLDEGGDGFFGVEGGVPMDPLNPKGSRGPASFNIPQIVTGHVEYELPIGTGKLLSAHNRAIDYAIGNWQFTSLVIARTGQNFDILVNGDPAETGNGKNYMRANLVSDPYTPGTVAANPSCQYLAPTVVKTKANWFNPCAFMSPLGNLGTFGRNRLHAQDFWDLDSSLSRSFPIHEALAFSLKADAFNIMNHPTLGVPVGTAVGGSGFGAITSVATNGYGATGQRILQLSGKIEF